MYFMKKQIIFYRVVLNMLFYVFYVLLVSILFSFIFPTILVILWKSVLEPNDPVFANIQIAIVVLVFIFTLTFRKFFYLPVFREVEAESKTELTDNKPELTGNIESNFSEIKEEKVEVIENNVNKTEEVKYEVIYDKENITNKADVVEEKILVDNFPDLDIKIGKEIK